MDQNNPWAASKDPFYVIISREGVDVRKTVLRLVSKLFSVAAFTFSTALFASSTLVTISFATIAMAMILSAGIFGRVTAMWISSVLMRDRPVLHRVVKDKKEASIFIEAILRKDNLICEVLEHVVINGRCVERYGLLRRLRWSRFLGVVARPYDVRRLTRPM